VQGREVASGSAGGARLAVVVGHVGTLLSCHVARETLPRFECVAHHAAGQAQPRAPGRVMDALIRQAARRSDAWAIGRRETVRVEGAQTRVVATRGRRPLDVTLLIVIGLALIGICGATVVEHRMMRGYCAGSPTERTRLKLGQMMYEALPAWALEHPDRRCPASLGELVPFLNSHNLDDPWGHRIELYCGVAVSWGRPAIWARSAGPDGELATDDDIVLAN
jgi:hypothetical protein